MSLGLDVAKYLAGFLQLSHQTAMIQESIQPLFKRKPTVLFEQSIFRLFRQPGGRAGLLRQGLGSRPVGGITQVSILAQICPPHFAAIYYRRWSPDRH
jgi:hypothetical protein